MPRTLPGLARLRSGGIAFLIVLTLSPALTGRPARADVTPMLNASVVASASRSGPVLDSKVDLPPTGPPGPWNGSVFSYASDPPYYAYGSMSISFSATTQALRVFTGGAGQVSGDGVHYGTANLNYFFISNVVQNATFGVTLTLHDIPGAAGALLFPLEVQGNVPYRILGLPWGTTNSSFRIPPGTWLVHAFSQYDSTALTGTAPTFSVDVDFVDCPAPLVTSQPTAQNTQAGATSNFSVGVAGGVPSSSVSNVAISSVTTVTTYQWRRNLVNLANGGRISGATTNHLVISNTAFADSGYYDVIVTQGTVVEGSSLAKLTVSSTTEVGPSATIEGVELEPPAPDPAYGRTRVRFALSSAMPAGLQVMDVAGRVVKTLLPYGFQEIGARTLEWDGSREGGARAAPGVYFIRLRAGAGHVVRRVVNLN